MMTNDDEAKFSIPKAQQSPLVAMHPLSVTKQVITLAKAQCLYLKFADGAQSWRELLVQAHKRALHLVTHELF